jgi:hypothetical protein
VFFYIYTSINNKCLNTGFLANILSQNTRLPEGNKSSNFTFNNPFKPGRMKYKILLVAFSAALITGCSTAYQAGQTPDDVYYSPAREGVAREEVVREERTRTNNDRYQTYTSSEDDNYLRMRIRNRNRWNSIDDFDYWYNPYNSPYYSYSPYSRFSPYNNWYFTYNGPTWNTWGYNSYGWNYNRWNNYGWGGNYSYYRHPGLGSGYGYGGGYPVVIKNPVRTNTNVSRPSLGSYRNSNYNNSNNRSTFGETINKVFSPAPSNTYSNSNSSSSTYEAPSRSYNPPASTSSSSSSSSSSGSSSSGSSSTGTVRPPR